MARLRWNRACLCSATAKIGVGAVQMLSLLSSSHKSIYALCMRLSWKLCSSPLYIVVALAVGLALLFAAETDTSEQRLQPGPYAVGKQDFRLVDSTRTTAARPGIPEVAERVLETTVWYPAQNRSFEWLRTEPRPLARQACSAPLVVYSHGFMSFRGNGAYLARYLASHGYIVAAADFPLTRFGAVGGPQFTDVINQPGDVSFLIDSLVAWNNTAENRFAGCIDRERIAAVGLSLGGMTTMLLAFHPDYRDPRIQAVVSIAGPTAIFGKDFFSTTSISVMMIAGDIDAMVDYGKNAEQFKTWVPDATLVTLYGGSHTGFAGIAARLFRWLDNPDIVGCWALSGTLGSTLDVPDDFISKLRGQENENLNDLELIPCRNPELPTALRPQHQQTLTKHAVFSFLQSQFHPADEIRDKYTRILERSLAADNPEIGVSRSLSEN